MIAARPARRLPVAAMPPARARRAPVMTADPAVLPIARPPIAPVLSVPIPSAPAPNARNRCARAPRTKRCLPRAAMPKRRTAPRPPPVIAPVIVAATSPAAACRNCPAVRPRNWRARRAPAGPAATRHRSATCPPTPPPAAADAGKPALPNAKPGAVAPMCRWNRSASPNCSPAPASDRAATSNAISPKARSPSTARHHHARHHRLDPRWHHLRRQSRRRARTLAAVPLPQAGGLPDHGARPRWPPDDHGHPAPRPAPRRPRRPARHEHRRAAAADHRWRAQTRARTADQRRAAPLPGARLWRNLATGGRKR